MASSSGTGHERACKCGQMLVSNVIEVGFPCPFENVQEIERDAA